MRSLVLVILLVFLFNCLAKAQESNAHAKFTSSLNGVIGIELLFSAPSSQSIASRWGHSFILLRNPNIPIEQNLVLELVAEVSDADLSYVKALTSGYPFRVQISTFEEKVAQDTYFHGRNLSRMIVSLSELELKSVLAAVTEAKSKPHLLSNYNFFFNNCATGLSQLFIKAKLMSGKIFLPNKFQSAFQDAGISPFPQLIVLGRPGLLAKINSAFGALKDFKAFPIDFSDSDFALLQNAFGIEFLANFYYEPGVLSDAARAKLSQYLLPHFDNLSWEAILSMRAPPSELYITPASNEAADGVNRAREKFFGQEGLISDLNYFITHHQSTADLSKNVTLHISRILRDPSFKMIPVSRYTRGAGLSQQPRFNISNRKIYAEFWPDTNLNPESGLDSQYIELKAVQVEHDGSVSISGLTCIPDLEKMNQFKNCKLFFEGNLISLVGFKL